MKNLLEEDEINWKNRNGLCTDWAQEMCRRNTGTVALVRKETLRIIWTHCMLHREALAFRNMSEEIQTVLQAVIRTVNCVKNSSSRGSSLQSYVTIWRRNTWSSSVIAKHGGSLMTKHFTGYSNWTNKYPLFEMTVIIMVMQIYITMKVYSEIGLYDRHFLRQ